jgi:hypothetical protein
VPKLLTRKSSLLDVSSYIEKPSLLSPSRINLLSGVLRKVACVNYVIGFQPFNSVQNPSVHRMAVLGKINRGAKSLTSTKKSLTST